MLEQVRTRRIGPRLFLLALFLLTTVIAHNHALAEATVTFTKIANSGEVAGPGTPLGSAAHEWACTRDESSGLIWEVKTADGGLRDRQSTYTPFDSNPKTNAGWEGYRDSRSGKCLRSAVEDDSCNTEAYVSAVNRIKLCGFDDWRLPTVSELIAVAAETSNAESTSTPQLLPNTDDGWYWTGVAQVGVTAFSRVVLLPTRGRPNFYDGSYMVMVVRDGKTGASPMLKSDAMAK